MLRLIYQHHFWKAKIKPSLIKMSLYQLDLNNIQQTLKKFKLYTHQYKIINTKGVQNHDVTFDAIYNIFKKDIQKLYAEISKYILQNEDLSINGKIKIPIFYSQHPLQHTLQKRQVLLLLCLMSTMLIPIQQYHQKQQTRKNFHAIKDFSYIFSFQQYKTTCIVQYLKSALKNIQNTNLTIRRQVVIQFQNILKQKLESPMTKLMIQQNEADIENFNGEIKIDFANRYIGGGALFGGCVQQQIMFANRPQLYVSSLFCEAMKSNQALTFIGFKKYFKNKGYGHKTSYGGQQNSPYKFNKQLNRYQEYIVGIDAKKFLPGHELNQYQRNIIIRQILKSYVGFSAVKQKYKIVSGNWGCGAFRGNHQLKLIIQWISASMSGKNLIYCPFGYKEDILNKKLLKNLQDKKIGYVFDLLIKAAQQVNSNNDRIYQLMLKIMSKL